MKWEQLSKEQKEQYKKYCDKIYGKTFVFGGETHEPLYMNEKCELIDTKIIIDILFSTSLN
jgi:hypothetical protein